MVKYLNYLDEEKIPVRTTKYAFQMTNFELNGNKELKQQPEIIQTSILLWYSMEVGYRFIKKENPFKIDECPFILDYENNLELFIEQVNYFNGVDVMTSSKDEDENDKKKV
jgi:hypothetical protein